jgi:hypothetical protein
VAELEEALKKIDELEKALKKDSASIFHQGTRMILASLAGFFMQKLIESAYDQYLSNRQRKTRKPN